MYKFLVVIFFIIWSTNSFAFSNESNKYQNEITEFADRIERKMKSDKDLEIISEKIWFQRGQAPFKYFVNKEFVRKKEKKALEKLQNHWAVNQREYLKIENKYFPFNTPYFEKYFASTFSIFIDLYDGKISYGEFHKMKKGTPGRRARASSTHSNDFI